MAKTLGQLSETTALSDSDVMLVEQVNIDKKVSVTTIKQKMLELAGTTASSFAAGNHNHDGTYEPVVARKSAFNADFGTTHITVAYGDHDHNGVYEPVITKKSAFNMDFGTSHTTIAYGDHNHTSSTLTVVDILPDMTGGSGGVSVRNIGSTSARFANIYANEVHVGASSLYVNGKQVISDNSSVMTFKTDPDQGVTIKTTSTVAGSGNGNLTLQSDNIVGMIGSGGINIATGSSVPSKNITITNQSSGGQILLNSLGNIGFSSSTVNVTGDLTVSGNLTISGTTTTVNTQDILIKDNIVVLNSNQTGTPASLLESGIEVERGDQANYRFEFKESDQLFRIGMVGQLQAVATREDSPTANAIPVWNSSLNRFDTSIGVKTGSSTFAGNSTARTIGHGIGRTPAFVGVTPSANPNGYLGEVWYTADATNIYIYNSGSAVTAFNWMVF